MTGRRQLKRFRGTEQAGPCPHSLLAGQLALASAPAPRQSAPAPSCPVPSGARQQHGLRCRNPCPHRPGCSRSQPGYGCPCHQLGTGGGGCCPSSTAVLGTRRGPAGSEAWGNSALPGSVLCRVVLSVNDKWHYCQNSDILVGSRAMRDRHLRLLGYCLVQVSGGCSLPLPSSPRAETACSCAGRWAAAWRAGIPAVNTPDGSRPSALAACEGQR